MLNQRFRTVDIITYCSYVNSHYKDSCLVMYGKVFFMNADSSILKLTEISFKQGANDCILFQIRLPNFMEIIRFLSASLKNEADRNGFFNDDYPC